MAGKKVRLLDEGLPVSSHLTVNKSFAESFDRRKRREEIQKAKERARELGIDLEREEGDSSSTSEDEEADLLNDKVDAKFFKLLTLIKHKDPRLKDENFHMFSDSDFDEEQEDQPKGKKKAKPVLYKDLHIQALLQDGPDAPDEEEHSEVEVPVQEQNRLKNEFMQAVDDWEKTDPSSDTLLKPRKHTEQTTQDANIALPVLPTDNKADVEEVKDYWTKAESPDEAFLKRFMLKQEWKEEEPELMTYDEVVDGEDKKRDQEMELFELAYNYRFEEEGFEKIKTYAREVKDSVRLKSDSRKQQRAAKKERKDLEKQHKVEAIKHFKNLKKQEIMDRMQLINTLAGTETGFNPDILEEEFDPQKHDKEMAEIFNEEYYSYKEHEKDLEIPEEAVVKNDEKTNDIDIKRIETEVELPPEGGLGDWWLCDECKEPISAGTLKYDCPECDNYTLCEACRAIAEHPHRLKRGRVPRDCVPPTTYVAVCCNECGVDVTTQRRYDCRTCTDYTLCEACKGVKKHAHPLRCLEDELWKEYFALDFEGLVGGQTTRFKYRDVQPEDYGLEDEDILEMDDKTLNSLVSLKKLATYREDGKVNRANVRKKLKWMKKQKQQAKTVSAAPVADPAEDRLKSYGLTE